MRQIEVEKKKEKSPLEIKKKKKKDSMLNAAFELFISKGFSETSVSDITDRAGVGKGTFYIYFKDKFEIRNYLISHKSSQVFMNAANALTKDNLSSLEDNIVFVADNIINQLGDNKELLNFISKNLSWGIFKKALTDNVEEGDINFADVYNEMLENSEYEYKEPEIMIYMIVELVSSTIYSSILYNEPVDIEVIKPYLFDNIRYIIKSHKLGKKDGKK